MRLKIGSNQLEIINEPGEFDCEDSNIEGWIPDMGTGNPAADLTAILNNADKVTQLAGLQDAICQLNIHNLNSGYMNRKEVYNNANGVVNRFGSWIKWPLGSIFAFFDHKKVTINLPI